MAGIAGAVSPRLWEPGPLLDRMCEPLIYHAGSQAEHWRDLHAGLCRVRCGNPNVAAQPVFSRRSDKCIVFFGECVGYEDDKRELEGRGRNFEHGECDAEFCLSLYEEYGERAFARLSGSFCFAIYDRSTCELLLVSDRLGSRPLFHGIGTDGVLVFATQVSAVLKSAHVSRALDTSAVLEFCAMQRILGTKTYHQGVQVLPPASVLRFAGGKAQTKPYRVLDYRPQPGSIEE